MYHVCLHDNRSNGTDTLMITNSSPFKLLLLCYRKLLLASCCVLREVCVTMPSALTRRCVFRRLNSTINARFFNICIDDEYIVIPV